ncbi:hypothetical protein EST54_17645 [Streptomyces sioyaensis]|uniref:Uncharacterized protein n=1 Tax=Streptomyces sioyaensis TaxID=67364 RepID=A0A4V1NPR6_9ACTN|nr:hypothetical protein EST54_17645 [Streptomyces sioyaensis]
MNGGPGLVRTIPGKLLSWLLPGRGGHRATIGTGISTGEDRGPARRPYVAAPQARQRAAQEARRRELEEAVRRLNTWSSGGGGRR